MIFKAMSKPDPSWYSRRFGVTDYECITIFVEGDLASPDVGDEGTVCILFGDVTPEFAARYPYADLDFRMRELHTSLPDSPANREALIARAKAEVRNLGELFGIFLY